MSTESAVAITDAPEQDSPRQLSAVQTEGVAPLVMLLASGQLKATDVEQAMALQKQRDEYDAKRAFSVALARFRSQVGNVVKDREGHHKGTFYATLGAVAKTVSDPLATNGLSYYWTDAQSENGALTVTCHLMHELGYEITTSLSSAPDTQGGKSAIQAIASARSYLCRYTLLGLLGLASEDDDGQCANKPPVETLSSAEIDELEELAVSTGGDGGKWRAMVVAQHGSSVPRSAHAKLSSDILKAQKARKAKAAKEAEKTEASK